MRARLVVMDQRRGLQLHLRRRASWWLGIVALLAGVLVVFLLMKWRRADSASRETVMVRFARGTSSLSSLAVIEVERAARRVAVNREPAVAAEPSRDLRRSREENEALTKARVSTVRHAIEQRGVAPERLDRPGVRDRSR
jgi:hypothetical protein